MKKEKIINAFKMPVFEAGSSPHFELNGSYEMLVDGCEGIMHYSEKRIRLNCGSEVIDIKGFELQLEHLGDKEAAVKGRILSFEFI